MQEYLGLNAICISQLGHSFVTNISHILQRWLLLRCSLSHLLDGSLQVGTRGGRGGRGGLGKSGEEIWSFKNLGLELKSSSFLTSFAPCRAETINRPTSTPVESRTYSFTVRPVASSGSSTVSSFEESGYAKWTLITFLTLWTTGAAAGAVLREPCKRCSPR